MSSWLYDDKGRVVRPGSQELSASLGVPATPEAEAYAILNIGYVGVNERRRGPHVQYRPKTIADGALAALLYYLFDNAERPIIISWYGDVWSIERAPNGRVASTFICHSLDSRHPLVGKDRIKTSPSLKALKRWGDGRERIEASLRAGSRELTDCLDLLFWGRWMLLDVNVAKQDVSIAERGAGYPMYDPILSQKSKSASMSDLQDPYYRQWAMNSCLAVASSNTPTFDEVDAHIAWPRIGDMRSRYWRMLVPLYRSATSTRLLAASGSDSGIDLRPETAEEMRNILGRVAHGHPAENSL